MKTGKTISELAAELERQNEVKKDFIAPTEKIRAVAELEHGAPRTTINLPGIGQFPILTHAHGQMAQYLDVPKKYYDRMVADAPGLWSITVNRWLDDHAGERRMIRTLDDSARALLSDSYRPLENFDLAEAILPTLSTIQGLTIESAEITERRMYIKAVDRDRVKKFSDAAIELGLTPGRETHFMDIWSPAVTISNSEVGSGSLSIAGSGFCHGCTNLTVFQDVGMKKYHIGTRADVSADTYALLTDETKAKSDEAIWMQARDITAAAFDFETFGDQMDKIQATQDNPIAGEVTEVVNRCADKYSLTKDEGSSMLEHLIRGGDFSQYGLMQSVTRTAQDCESYDRASDLEKLGGRIVELPKSEWERLAA